MKHPKNSTIFACILLACSSTVHAEPPSDQISQKERQCMHENNGEICVKIHNQWQPCPRELRSYTHEYKTNLPQNQKQFITKCCCKSFEMRHEGFEIRNDKSYVDECWIILGGKYIEKCPRH